RSCAARPSRQWADSTPACRSTRKRTCTCGSPAASGPASSTGWWCGTAPGRPRGSGGRRRRCSTPPTRGCRRSTGRSTGGWRYSPSRRSRGCSDPLRSRGRVQVIVPGFWFPKPSRHGDEDLPLSAELPPPVGHQVVVEREQIALLPAEDGGQLPGQPADLGQIGVWDGPAVAEEGVRRQALLALALEE